MSGTISKNTSRQIIIKLIKELNERPADDDIVILARRTNARRLDHLKVLDQELTILTGLEQSGKYEGEAIERAARIIAAEHAGVVQDIEIEIEALKKAYSEKEE